jgi:hypothetical protein
MLRLGIGTLFLGRRKGGREGGREGGVEGQENEDVLMRMFFYLYV